MGNACADAKIEEHNINNQQWSLYSRLQRELESGCEYRGEWKDGKPNGLGTAQWPDGWTFEGEFVDGKPHGGNLRSPGVLMDESLQSPVSVSGLNRPSGLSGQSQNTFQE